MAKSSFFRLSKLSVHCVGLLGGPDAQRASHHTNANRRDGTQDAPWLGRVNGILLTVPSSDCSGSERRTRRRKNRLKNACANRSFSKLSENFANFVRSCLTPTGEVARTNTPARTGAGALSWMAGRLIATILENLETIDAIAAGIFADEVNHHTFLQINIF